MAWNVVAFRFADGRVADSKEIVDVNVKKMTYTAKMCCYVLEITNDIILGIPFLESIIITHQDLTTGKMEFHEKEPKRNHRWKIDGMVNEVTISEVQENRGGRAETGEETAHPTEKKDEEQLSKEMLERFSKIFEEPNKLPPARPEDMEIRLEDGTRIPASRTLRQMNTESQAIVKAHVEELLQKGFIAPSKSAYGAAVLLVEKKGEKARMCIDYRALNKITVKDSTVPPLMSDCLTSNVGGKKWFSKLDLRDGFFNVRIVPHDQEKTAFRTKYGTFEYKVVPFGLCNSPATFTRMMNRILGDLVDRCVSVYVDDILVHSNSLEEHTQDLAEVLKRIRENTLFVKPEKCILYQKSISFCGFLINGSGIRPLVDSVAGIGKMTTPTNVKEMQSFLGSLNYFRQFSQRRIRCELSFD